MIAGINLVFNYNNFLYTRLLKKEFIYETKDIQISEFSESPLLINYMHSNDLILLSL